MSAVVIGIAVGAGTLVALVGASLLKSRAAPPSTAETDKAQVSGMRVQLCRKGIERLGDGMQPLLEALRERRHTPVVRECLSRCEECKSGGLLAIADGMPLCAASPEKLLGDLDEISGDR